MSITVYTYDWKTKEFLFTEEADESPLEPGVYLIPKFSTDIPVPTLGEHDIAIFDDVAKTWTVESTLPEVITPEPVEPDPLRPLAPYQFWGVLKASGYEQPIRDYVAAIVDVTERSIAEAMLEYSLEFRRDHPLIEAARVAINLTTEELDTLWTTAHNF